MKFLIIRPKEKTSSIEELPSIKAAWDSAGLQAGCLDFGQIDKHTAFCVYEFGLFVDPSEQHYFALGRSLIAGNAVCFGVNEFGDTVDFESFDDLDIRFFDDSEHVKAALASGLIDRPQCAVNSIIIWQWPDSPPPEFIRHAMR